MQRRTKPYALLAFALCLASAAGVQARPGSPAGKEFTLGTKSTEARDLANQVLKRVESFQVNAETRALAEKAVAADPNFAFGHFLVATTSPMAAAKPHMDKAIELAKTASEGERKYIDAVALARAQQMDKAVPALAELAKEYPGWRPARMILAQIYLNTGKLDEAKAMLDEAIKLDASTPRAHALLGSYYLLKEDYANARASYATALARKAPGTYPFLPHFGTAYTHVYQGDFAGAIKFLEAFRDDYAKSPDAKNFPPVFIWNAIARLQLESGRPEDAIKSYEAGYATVPGSTISDENKTIWMGRLHHGRGRALAKMGKIDDAWKEAEYIKKLIDENGERGKQFLPAYHYIAGYVKLEAGEYAAAVEHLKQADGEDDFHKLLLARAYEKAGDEANAQKVYKEILTSYDVNLERALGYAEAKRKARG
jgi:tetratricopeptide (TPR) repeat protein